MSSMPTANVDTDPFYMTRQYRGSKIFTPRHIAYDLKGSLGTLSEHGYLASEYSVDADQIQPAWEGQVENIPQIQLPKSTYQRALEDYEQSLSNVNVLQDKQDRMTVLNERLERYAIHSQQDEITVKNLLREIKDLEFDIKRLKSKELNNVQEANRFQLDGNVRFWSDYDKNYIHPKSIFINENYQHNEPFDIYTWGTMSTTRKEDYLDQLRFFLEECENFEGFQTFVDMDNGFGCVASDILLELRDEFPRKSILSFGTMDTPSLKSSTTKREENERLTLNQSLSLYHIKEYSSMLVLLSQKSLQSANLPWIRLTDDKYQTSAVFASAIETCTLPYRFKENRQQMGSFLSHVARTETMSLVGLTCAFPLPIESEGNLFSVFRNKENALYKAPFMASLSPMGTDSYTEPFTESIMLRGVPKWMLERSQIDDFGAMDLLFHNLIQYQTPHRSYRACDEPSTIPVPYPEFFNPKLTETGILSHQNRAQNHTVQSIPMLTHLQTTSRLQPKLQTLANRLHEIDMRFHTSYEIEEDDLIEVKENLFSISESYEESK